jgi:pimeloyl-ACP methyl ester carboxylesterase
MARRILLAALAALVLGALVLVAGSLPFWDWSRSYGARTAALPVLSPGTPSGLVRIEAGGLAFRARVAGLDARGPGLILLHGYPETSAMWEPLLEAAGARGYRVIAFDQRGYSPGARPAGVDAYRIEAAVGDVLAVADAAGFDGFHLVGHDWGCVVGWIAAVRHPDRLRSWTGISIPHPGPMIQQLQGGLPAYIRVFKTPWLPELLFSFGDFALLRRGLPAGEARRDEYVAALAEPGALSAALNWYRAIPASLASFAGESFDVRPPTLFVWGRREAWVTPERLERQRALARGPYDELEVDAGHWVMEEQTQLVVDRILAHLAASDASAPGAGDAGSSSTEATAVGGRAVLPERVSPTEPSPRSARAGAAGRPGS